MNPFALPWLAFTLLALLLACLFLREVLIGARVPINHPERKMAYFNALMLAILLVGVCYGARLLSLHEAEFAAMYPRYPNARFAPERQFFGESDWTYVTHDAPESVIDYYVGRAASEGFRVIIPSDGQKDHILLSSPQQDLFLTARKEGGLTVLYFTASGTISSYEVTRR